MLSSGLDGQMMIASAWASAASASGGGCAGLDALEAHTQHGILMAAAHEIVLKGQRARRAS